MSAWADLVRFRAVRDVEYQCTCGLLSVVPAGQIVKCPECQGRELEVCDGR